jgi:hypothetical protein
LSADIQVNDYKAYKKLQFITLNGKDTNIFDNNILKNFMDQVEIDQSRNLRSLTENDMQGDKSDFNLYDGDISQIH